MLCVDGLEAQGEPGMDLRTCQWDYWKLCYLQMTIDESFAVLCASCLQSAVCDFTPYPWWPINHPSATYFRSLQVNTNALLPTSGELPPPTLYSCVNPNWTISKTSPPERWAWRKVLPLALNAMHPMVGPSPVCIGCCRAKTGWRPSTLPDWL